MNTIYDDTFVRHPATGRQKYEQRTRMFGLSIKLRKLMGGNRNPCVIKIHLKKFIISTNKKQELNNTIYYNSQDQVRVENIILGAEMDVAMML